MDVRPTWRGHLRLALVSCPIALYPVVHDRANLHFHMINPKTGHRVRMVTRDAETDEDLSRADLVKGYEFKKDHYLLMEDADFEAARIESSSVLTIEKFVPGDSIDPVYFDASYYVAPDGDTGSDVYLVLREAVRQSGMAALSRIVMAQRERVVALALHGEGLVVHALHESRDIHAADRIFEAIPQAKADPEMVKLARQLIDRQTGTYDPSDWDDRYEKRLRTVIEAKLKGEGVEPEQAEPEEINVIDLMATLKKSLGLKAEAKRPAQAKPARKRTARRP